MSRFIDTIKKWSGLILLVLWAICCFFALGCCIYTAIVNPFVGVVGCIGAGLTAIGMVNAIVLEIKHNHK